MLLSEAEEILKKNGYRLDEAALTMRSLNKTLNKLFGSEYNVVADVSPRKWYIQYYDFDTGIYVTGELKADRLSDLSLEEWIEETKKVAKEVKKSKIRRFGEAHDAVIAHRNEKSSYIVENAYSDIELKSLEVKDGELYATFVIAADAEKYIKDYNIWPGDEFTSKVRFNDKGDPYVTGLNHSVYRWYFGGDDYDKIVAKARDLRR